MLLHVLIPPRHPQEACLHYLAKLHKYSYSSSCNCRSVIFYIFIIIVLSLLHLQIIKNSLYMY